MGPRAFPMLVALAAASAHAAGIPVGGTTLVLRARRPPRGAGGPDPAARHGDHGAAPRPADRARDLRAERRRWGRAVPGGRRTCTGAVARAAPQRDQPGIPVARARPERPGDSADRAETRRDRDPRAGCGLAVHGDRAPAPA